MLHEACATLAHVPDARTLSVAEAGVHLETCIAMVEQLCPLVRRLFLHVFPADACAGPDVAEASAPLAPLLEAAEEQAKAAAVAAAAATAPAQHRAPRAPRERPASGTAAAAPSRPTPSPARGAPASPQADRAPAPASSGSGPGTSAAAALAAPSPDSTSTLSSRPVARPVASPQVMAASATCAPAADERREIPLVAAERSQPQAAALPAAEDRPRVPEHQAAATKQDASFSGFGGFGADDDGGSDYEDDKW
jgi:translation initiation factor IF-2